MEPFDVAVAFRMMISRAAMRDAKPREGFHESRRGKLCAVVCGQRQIAFSTPCRQPVEHRLFYRVQCFLRATTIRKIPAHDFPRTTVDHADQIRPTYCRSCPNLRHVRLPDLIWLGCFHPSPLFLPACSQPPGANQQASFTHHPQHSFLIHSKSFLPAQPPSHPAIAVRRFFSAGPNDFLIPPSIRSATSWLLPVVQARSTDDQRRGHHRCRVPLFDQRSRLGVNSTAAHSPTTFFRISISRDLRPRVRSSCRMRRSFSVSAAAALFPPSAAFAPSSASSFQR